MGYQSFGKTFLTFYENILIGSEPCMQAHATVLTLCGCNLKLQKHQKDLRHSNKYRVIRKSLRNFRTRLRNN
jgi:hypothetical protein